MSITSGVEKLLFVSNMGDDSISVVDIKNRKEMGRISLLPVPDMFGGHSLMSKKSRVGPHSIKTDKANKNLYSINCFDNSISVLDINGCSIEESFFAGSHPNDMVFNIEETYMYVTNGDADSVSIIDVSSKKIIAQISVGVMPHSICISPDGEYIYVSNIDSSSISILDTWSNSKVSCVKVPKCPVGVLTSRDGRFLYVACSYPGSDKNGVVSIISTNNYRIIKNVEVGIFPVQLCLSGNGRNLYVTNMGSNDISTIDLNMFEEVNRFKTGGNMTRDITVVDEKYIITSNSESNNLSVIKKDIWKNMYNIEVGLEPTSMLYINKPIP